jgi:hypothetical protein
MQQSEVFKSGEAIIQALEKQLTACENISKVCEQSAREATQQIEEHFARCMNTLAARKEVLLREVAQNVADQSKLSHILFVFLVLFVSSFCTTFLFYVRAEFIITFNFKF